MTLKEFKDQIEILGDLIDDDYEIIINYNDDDLQITPGIIISPVEKQLNFVTLCKKE